MKTISRIIGRWRGSDGHVAEVVHEGSHASGSDRWAEVDNLRAPVTRLNTAVDLTTGERVILPAIEIAHLLPDATCVLVLFEPSRETAGDIRFAPPHNAAIFNADGSLRFQLKNPAGEDGIFRAVVLLTLPDGSRGLGVRACPRSYPSCESVYLVDGSTDDLSKQVPRWVRD